MEDQQRQTDAGQAGVQSLQAPEEGHPQPQLDPASPAQLVRAQPRLDLSVGGDLESEDSQCLQYRDIIWASALTCSTLIRPICISGSSGLIRRPSSSLTSDGH